MAKILMTIELPDRLLSPWMTLMRTFEQQAPDEIHVRVVARPEKITTEQMKKMWAELGLEVFHEEKWEDLTKIVRYVPEDG